LVFIQQTFPEVPNQRSDERDLLDDPERQPENISNFREGEQLPRLKQRS
jgi:hypothetical protein